MHIVVHLRHIVVPDETRLRDRIRVVVHPQVDQRERMLVHHQQRCRLLLVRLATGVLTRFQCRHQALGQMSFRAAGKRRDHRVGHGRGRTDVADCHAGIAFAVVVGKADALAVEEAGGTGLVDDGELAVFHFRAGRRVSG